MTTRRKWRESLQSGISSENQLTSETPKKKPKKISIVEQKIFKNGKLVQVRNNKKSKSNNLMTKTKGYTEANFSQEQSDLKDLSRTPRQLSPLRTVENITPTFRKPEYFLAEAKQILNKISPSPENNVFVPTILQGTNNVENSALNSTDTNDSIKKYPLIDTSLVESKIFDFDSSLSDLITLKKPPKRISDSDQSIIEGTPENEKNKQILTKKIDFDADSSISDGQSTFKDGRLFENETLFSENDQNNLSLDEDNMMIQSSYLSKRTVYTESKCDGSGDQTESRKTSDLEEFIVLKQRNDNDNENDEYFQRVTVEVVIEKHKEEGDKNSYDSTRAVPVQDRIVVNHNIIEDEIEQLSENNSTQLDAKSKTFNDVSTILPDPSDDILFAIEDNESGEQESNFNNEEEIKHGSILIESKDGSNVAEVNTGKRKSKRKIAVNKSYLDFVEEEDIDQMLLNEAFPSEDSSSGFSTETSSTSESDDKKKGGKKATKKSKKMQTKKKKNNNDKIQTNSEETIPIPIQKKKRMYEKVKENKAKKDKGESYMNKRGEIVAAKLIKPYPCIGVNCGNGCGNIPEEKRLTLFNYFWNLSSHQRRKDWISQCAIKKKIKNPARSRNQRSCSYDYYVNEGEGRRKVCQKYLLATLDISQRFVLYTLETMNDGFAKVDERGKCGGQNKTHDAVLSHAREFIMSLPLVPSHYCRKDSSRLYLPQEFKNISNLYRIYVDNCNTEKVKSMSFKVFNTWFKKTFNIAFHVPKKDKCLICSADNPNEKTKEEAESVLQHKKEKEESYKRFKFHQELYKKDKTTLCASFDMQKVLNTPHGTDMRLYYSRKLSVYNFTIYESGTREGHCYVWNETDAHRGANEISTCLLDFIKNVDSRGSIKTLLLYCDSCYGQNKNKTVLSMLRFALSQCENLNVIQINYLIPGHTYMPVDSVHATIENAIKKTIIWAPSQWPTIFQVARQNPSHYKVNILKGEQFMGFDNITNNTFKKSQKLAMSKIKIVTFNKQKLDVMNVKYSMLDDSATEISLPKLTNNVLPKFELYPEKLPVTINKYNNLKNLVDKKVIPQAYAHEYLCMKVNKKLKDRLEDTDEEDTDVEK